MFCGGWTNTDLLIATGLDSSLWHQITMTGTSTDGQDNDTWSYEVNGGTPVAGGAYFETARDNYSYGYEMTNRLRFQPRHANWDETFSGFYFDEVVTQVSNSNGVLASFSTGLEAGTAAVPGPSSLTLLGLAGYGWRRRKQPIA